MTPLRDESTDRFKQPSRPLRELLAESTAESTAAIVAAHRRGILTYSDGPGWPRDTPFTIQEIADALNETLLEVAREPRTNVWGSFWDRLLDGDPAPELDMTQ